MPKQKTRIFTNVYINNIDTSVDESTLRTLCEQKGGKVVSLVIIRDSTTKASLGYGFCSFSTHAEAKRAVANLTNTLVGSKRITLSRASSKSERARFLSSVRQQQQQQQQQQNGNGNSNVSECPNVYVKGLAADEEEEGLRKMFMRFGPIINVRVMRSAQGKSRGFGFVSFKNPQDAARAVAEMNRTCVGTQTLGVSFYEPKNVRRERLCLLHGSVTTPPNSPEQQQQQQLQSSSLSSSSSSSSLSSSPLMVGDDNKTDVEIVCEHISADELPESREEEESLSQSPTILSALPLPLPPLTSAGSSRASSPLASSSSSPSLHDSEDESGSETEIEKNLPEKGGGGGRYGKDKEEEEVEEESYCRQHERNTIVLSGLKLVTDPREISQIFYEFRNVKAEPVLSSRSVMSGQWKVSFETHSDAERALEIVSQNLYVRSRRVYAEMLLS